MRQTFIYMAMLALVVTTGCAATGSMGSGDMDDSREMMMEKTDEQEMMMEESGSHGMMETDSGKDDKMKMEMQ